MKVLDISNNNIKSELISEYNLKIYQDDRFFKYGIDSVELTKFICKCELGKKDIKDEDIKKYKNKKAIDICSGTGIIGLILQRIFQFEEINFIEKQEYFSELNEHNAKENLIEEKYKVFNMDICKVKKKDIENLKENFDLISVNPPYKKHASGIDASNNEKTIARKEGEDFLENLFEFSYYILKDKAKMYMVNRIDRIIDVFETARKYKLEPKKLQFLINNKNQPILFFTQFVKNGGEFLAVLENRVIN